jgi:transcriptional regulator GlxA family with amidase domain
MLELKQGRCSSFTTGRLLEAFFGEAIRAYRRTQGSKASGWFAGLSDTRVVRAIQLIHAQPGHPWSVAELARRIGLSPSRFAARFRTRCGDSVMSYVGTIRFNTACQLLRETDLPVSRVAEQVGYDSLPAFSRTFKVLLGKPPTAWRLTNRPELRQIERTEPPAGARGSDSRRARR